VFGSVGTVFQTPTTSELSNQSETSGGFNPDLEPTTGESYEIGARADLGSIAALEATIYRTDLDNELVAYGHPVRDGIFYFENAGSSKHEGVEVTLSAAAGAGLFRADLTYAQTNARFVEHSVEVNGVEIDASGNRVPGVAPSRVQAVVRLSPDFSFGGAFIEAIGTWMDDVPTDDENIAVAPSYELVDIRAGLDGIELGGLSLSPWVAITNVTNEEYIAAVAVNAPRPTPTAPATARRFYEPGPEQSFQVGLRAAFGGGN
jgi:iron complex outermembrane receptor protein